MVKLLFLVNDAGFFLSHRAPIALEARRHGYEVHVATAPGPFVDKIRDLGLVYHPVQLSRSGKNPLFEFYSITNIFRLFRRLRPDIVHLVTIKPVLYGGVCARLARIPFVVAAISGLGTVFIGADLKTNLIRRIITPLYRFSLNRPNTITIFQNPDDRLTISRLAGLAANSTRLIEGSGVDLRTYRVTDEPKASIVVTMAARLLRDKGVREFIDAARLLREKGVRATFWLVGDPDPGNPTSITAEELAIWREERIVTLWGHRSDIDQIFAQSNIVVLPSYREGSPKVLLEAAACGRPIVTTDVPGCRDAIIPNKTGLLVPPRDPVSLANAIESLILDENLRREFGLAGRALAEQKFAIEHVVNQHLQIYDSLSGEVA